jgi:hypothetical protein
MRVRGYSAMGKSNAQRATDFRAVWWSGMRMTQSSSSIACLWMNCEGLACRLVVGTRSVTSDVVTKRQSSLSVHAETGSPRSKPNAGASTTTLFAVYPVKERTDHHKQGRKSKVGKIELPNLAHTNTRTILLFSLLFIHTTSHNHYTIRFAHQHK